ncbi:unnamed protein product [Allacma fusca]|uniref:Uncharacterized protein n=1 Tax=Allacma fusca TaxID=39272 RepID=A0A8J2LH83_9HEXA|nr:unnamed protein product [Allacma fusca]
MSDCIIQTLDGDSRRSLSAWVPLVFYGLPRLYSPSVEHILYQLRNGSSVRNEHKSSMSSLGLCGYVIKQARMDDFYRLRQASGYPGEIKVTKMESMARPFLTLDAQEKKSSCLLRLSKCENVPQPGSNQV